MAHVRGLNFFHLENREELVFAEFEKRVALAAVQFFEIENVFVKRDRLFDIVDFDRDVIASVNLYAHEVIYRQTDARQFFRATRRVATGLWPVKVNRASCTNA